MVWFWEKGCPLLVLSVSRKSLDGAVQRRLFVAVFAARYRDSRFDRGVVSDIRLVVSLGTRFFLDCRLFCDVFSFGAKIVAILAVLFVVFLTFLFPYFFVAVDVVCSYTSDTMLCVLA